MEDIQFDDVLRHTGKLGYYQWYMLVLTGLGNALVGAHCLANVFISGIPFYWCEDYYTNWTDTTTSSSCGGSTHMSETHQWCSSPCQVDSYSGTDGEEPNVTNDQELKCQNWTYDGSVYGVSVVSKWQLVCSSEWKVALSQSTFMLGFTLAAFSLGNLSDIFGRKRVWLLSMLMVLLTGVPAAFMPNYWAFIATRAVSGFFVAGIYNSGFVLLMEVTGSNGRILIGIIYNGCFSLGYMILPGLAYFIKDYMYLQLTITLAAILFLPYVWLLDESPRWLLTKNRNREAIAVVKKVAKKNKKSLPDELLTVKNVTSQNNVQVDKGKTQTYSIMTVLKYPTMRWRLLNVSFNWFVNSFVYYGLSLASADLVGGPYINLFLSGLMELPSLCVCVLMSAKLGRRLTVSGFLLSASMCALAMSFIPQDFGVTQVVLSLFGKFCISGSFCIIYIYTAEMFPTVVRNLVVGCGSTCTRIGSTIAPFILLTGGYWRPLPIVCFGTFSLTAGLLSLLLPETLKQKLPDTLIEGENFGKSKAPELSCICKKTVDNMTEDHMSMNVSNLL